MNAVALSVDYLKLVGGVVALALGLSGVTAGLWPVGPPSADYWPSSRRVEGRTVAAPCPCADGGLRSEPRAVPLHVTDEPSAASLPPALLADPPISPLYPRNHVTLWDRIRVSSKRDVRAFLLGTAIQVHAPAIAATPGARFAP